jgi:hypothetical protein
MAAMIADGPPASVPGESRYRGDVRNSSRATWLIIGIGFALLIASRFVRVNPPIWLVLSAIVLILAVTIGRQFGSGSVSGFRRTPPRNVTPDEPTIAPGATIEPIARPPEVIVVEPGDDGERLEAKLQALDRLRANGLVSEAEYEAKRARLIAEF